MIGFHDEIDALATELASRCTATGTRYGAAVAARHRRVESTANVGDREHRADVDAIRWSIGVFDDLDAPFERARSLTALAQVTDDGELAREAADEFDRLGTNAWANRARAAVRGSNQRSSVVGLARRAHSKRTEQSVGLSALTSAELRVSEAVARGLTNRDIAVELFISPKTVEYHLRNIFRKLNIARRAELVARFHTAHLTEHVGR
jgi:DNA-binding CsgD family transcriptional regulator